MVVSDGVNDNMDPTGYHGCMRAYQWSSPSATWDEHNLVSHATVADCIACTAYFLGKDAAHDSPFARSARSYGKRYRGGKHDDITVTVAQIRLEAVMAGVGDHTFPADREDPHRSESVFVYTESDSPIPSVDQLPTMIQTLKASSWYGVNVEGEVEVDSLPKYQQSEL